MRISDWSSDVCSSDLQATVYLDACSGGMIPIGVSRAWAERAVGVQAWARSIGIESMHAAGGWYPKLPGFDSIEVYGPMRQGHPQPCPGHKSEEHKSGTPVNHAKLVFRLMLENKNSLPLLMSTNT